MRQALVIKNPKWELFTEASDAFKAVKEGENAVLVVRGRCKEKRVKTKPDKIAKAAALLLFLCLFGFSASAQQNLIGYLPATTVAGASTNATAGTGVIGWNIDQVAVFQLTVVSTNTASGAFTVDFRTSDNGTDWKTMAYSVAVTANGTTAATDIIRLTNTVGGKYLQVQQVRNPSASAVSVSRFTLSLKEQ